MEVTVEDVSDLPELERLANITAILTDSRAVRSRQRWLGAFVVVGRFELKTNIYHIRATLQCFVFLCLNDYGTSPKIANVRCTITIGADKERQIDKAKK